jgi:hypothetical protein
MSKLFLGSFPRSPSPTVPRLLGERPREAHGGYHGGLRDSLIARYIDAGTHQIAVARLNDLAQVNADAKDDVAVLWHAGVALDHGVLNFDRATHGIDDAAEFDDRADAGALDYAALVNGDGRITIAASFRVSPMACKLPAVQTSTKTRPKQPRRLTEGSPLPTAALGRFLPFATNRLWPIARAPETT